MEIGILGKPAPGTKSYNFRKDLTLEGKIDMGIVNK